jgi:hypothetical protein
MVKEARFFRKLADKTERMARAASDAEVSEGFLSLARAHRRAQKWRRKIRAENIGEGVCLRGLICDISRDQQHDQFLSRSPSYCD